MTTDVVITGVGLDVPSGVSLDELLDSVLDKPATTLRSGLPLADGVDATPSYAGQDRPTAFAMKAAVIAASTDPLEAGDRTGVIVASTTSNIDVIARVAIGLAEESYRVVRPAEVLTISGTQVTAAVSCWFNARAFAYGSCTGNAAGLDALALARTALRRGRADRVLIVGTESPEDASARLIEEAEGGRPLFSGGVALIAANARATTGSVTVGTEVGAIGAGETLGQATNQITTDDVGIVFLPAGTAIERSAARDWIAEAYPDAQIVDLWNSLGDVQGALGVLQCALAVTWLTKNPGQSALIIAGSMTDRDLVSTLLTPWRNA